MSIDALMQTISLEASGTVPVQWRLVWRARGRRLARSLVGLLRRKLKARYQGAEHRWRDGG